MPGRALVLLSGSERGDLVDAETEFGSSEYAKEILGALWGFPPALELEHEANLQRCIIDAINQGFVESAHDLSEGGIAVALAEAGFQNGIGARVELKSDDLPAEYVLFGEDASRVLVSCDRQLLSRIQEVAGKHGVAAEVIGETTQGNLEIVVDGQTVVSAPVSQLKSAWEGALAKALHTETEEHLVPEVLQKS